MASITAQTAHSTNASECSATLCRSESRSSEKTASPVAIEAKSFEFAYPPSEDPQTARASIGPLDWHVPQGAFQLLVGATGSGKTTLLRNCKPSIAPHGECAGELAVFGQLASQLDDRQSASLVGYVSQNPENQICHRSGLHGRRPFTSDFAKRIRRAAPYPAALSISQCRCACMHNRLRRLLQIRKNVRLGAPRFDLRVAQGSIHALIGGNGCGKSTLLRVIAGVQKLDRGACVNVLAQRQALLPQDPKGLFVCDTVQEELAEWQHACGYADADVDAIAQAFGLAERLSNHPYDLSGGQQQLLALAKLLLTKPSLLLLDEPTKGLDPQTKCHVAKAIQGQARAGVTVVMATHDLPFAALVADEATMLFDGESAATQPAPAFFADNLFYRPTCDSFAKQWLENEADR